MNATPICQNTYSQPNANTGIGSVSDLNSANQGCLTNGEVNSSWYILNTSTAGNIVFNITPNNATDDYDFAIWDLTDTSCGALSNGLTPIKCNFASLPNSSPGGLTGLSTTATQSSVGGAGPSFSSAITATAGQTYVILVNNNTGSANGYTINFTGSTSTIIDNTAPQIKSVIIPPNCNGSNIIKINLKENIKCSSLATNGSDFSINGGVTVSSAIGSSCNAGGNFSSSVLLTLNSNMAPGNYSVTIGTGSDGNTLLDNCNNAITSGTTFTFTVLPPVTVSVSTQFGCSGSTNGSITASGVNGYAPYKYKLNNGTYNLGNTFASLAAGTYTVSIKDSLGCIHDTIISLVAATPISINSVSIANLTCYNAANGSITVNANGGNPPLNYAVNSNSYSTNNIISNLAPGSYVVHVKDANGCIKDTVLLLTAPGPIFGSTINIKNAGCLNASTGSITYTAIGGTQPLQYALNTGAYSAFANYTNLAAGSYTIHIKDANNCIKDTVINITQPSTVLNTQTNNISQPNCSGTTGSITISGVGGTAPFTYSINGITFTSNNVFSGLSSGAYILSVKDAGGCVVTTSISLNSPGNVFFTNAILVQPTCVTTGNITVTAVGGTPPLSYAINTGTYSAITSFANLAAGSYTLHAKDNNNCIHDTILTLIAPSNPQIAINSISNTTCSNPNNGSITVAGGGGLAPLTFSFNGGSFNSATLFNNLVAGNYTIIVQDANGCSNSIIATIINSNTVAFASITSTNVACSGNPLGTITTSGIGGNAPFTYNINGGAFGSSGSFNNLTGATYTIVTKDANGCSASTTVKILVSVNLNISPATATNATCSNPGNGIINFGITGGLANFSYTLNGAGIGSTVINNLAPGNYTLQVTDALGCTKSTTLIITGPPKLFFTNTIVVLPPCFGGVGSISTNGTGGLPGYTFAINTGTYSGSGSFANLPAGSYIVHVKDANGCIHDTTINLMQPPPVAGTNLILSNAACNGNATGSITITGSGTVAPYTYNLNGGAWSATNIYSNLAAGSYTINIKDANGCTGVVVTSINNNGNFYFGTSNYTVPLCFGGNTGTCTFSGSAGSAPFQFAINTGIYQASNNFSNLSAGVYTLYVKDNGGCIVSNTITITNPLAPIYNNIIITPPLCNNGNNASLSFSAGGGTGVLSFAIDASAYGNTTSFINLASGTHTLHIKDVNNCIKDSVVNISNPAPLNLTNIAIINPGCFGPGNGSATVTVMGGTTPYTYAINTGSYSGNNIFNPLLANTYTIYAKDANQCSKSTIITLANTAGVTITSVSIQNPACANNSNGSISITATSANNPCIYSLNNASAISIGNYFNLGTGNYTIHVIDALGCYKDSILQLQSTSTLAISNISKTNLLCNNGTSGTITITTIGGAGSMEYAYNNIAYSAINVLNNLTNATYTIHAKDSIGCIVDSIVTLTAPAQVYFTNVFITKPYCNGSQDGIIAFSAIGGVAPYQYAINTGGYSSINNFSNLIQSNYTLHIKDANGCLHDTVIFLQGPDVVTFTFFLLKNISCFGASDGVITANAGGGISPYQFSLNNNPFSGNNQFTSLPVGSYTLNIKDNQGCLKDTIVNIAAPTSSVGLAVVNIINNICRGDSNATIQVIGTGGVTPYFYSFINTTNYTTNNTFTNLPAGTFIINIKDANGCTYDSTFKTTEPDSSVKIFLIGTTKNSCVGVYDATINVSAKNGFKPYQYYINGTPNGTDTFFKNLKPGDFVIEVVDSIGCKSSGKYYIDSSMRRSNIIITNLTNNICKKDAIGSATWQVTNPYLPVTNYFDSIIIGIDTFKNNLSSDTFYIKTIDAKGCKADTNIIIHYSDSIQVNTITTDASCSGFGDDGKALAIVSNGTAPYQYKWSNGKITIADSIENLIYTNYNVVVTDNNNCSAIDSFSINYAPCCNVWMPNAFTPNGDEDNKDIIMKPSGPVSLVSLGIYNRFGQQVFYTTNFNDKWNGTFNNEPCEVSTYFYVLRYNCPLANGIQIKKGDITLIR